MSASYPYGEAVFNISRETTHLELIDIEGISEHDRRMQGINLSAGATNAVEFSTTLFGLPTPAQWLEAFQADMAADQHILDGVEIREINAMAPTTALRHCTIPFDVSGGEHEADPTVSRTSDEEEMAEAE